MTETRGPQETKVCLEGRSSHVYYVNAITNYGDKKIQSPPGMRHIEAEQGFRGVMKEDLVRSSLWEDEIHRPVLERPSDPDLSDLLLVPLFEENDAKTVKQDSGYSTLGATDGIFLDYTANVTYLSGKTIPRLKHYGIAPGAINLPICRCWNGDCITTIDSNQHNNAPCLCDAVAPELRTSWSGPGPNANWTAAYTDKFILESGLYRSEAFGELCNNLHGCSAEETWKERLRLSDTDEPAKKMSKAWDTCKPRRHDYHPVTTISTASSTAVSPISTSTSDKPPYSWNEHSWNIAVRDCSDKADYAKVLYSGQKTECRLLRENSTKFFWSGNTKITISIEHQGDQAPKWP